MAAIEQRHDRAQRRRSTTTASSSSARRRFENAGDAVFGTIDMRQAMTVSSDVFFYTLGARMNGDGPILQSWARRLGLGRRTGIDIPGEFGGLVPDRQWRNEGFADYQRCAAKGGVEVGTVAGAAALRRHRAPLVGRRQRQPRGRPGRPAGHAAADGRRLLGDRQRRQGRPTPPRHERSRTARAARSRRSAARRAAQLKFDPGHREAIMEGLLRAPPTRPRAPHRTSSRASGAAS